MPPVDARAVRRGDVDVVLVAYGEEPWLREAVDSARLDPLVGEVLVWNNGFAGELSEGADGAPVRLLGQGENLGFAAGCNRAAAAGTGSVVVFLNSDARLRPGAVAALAAALEADDLGLAAGRVALADEPEIVNAAGNPVHVSLLSWAGGWGDPMADHQSPTETASVSGALFAVRRDVWQDLGGFWEGHFAYGEDVDLSLRCWQSGRSVRLVPDAVADHHYEFSRNRNKFYLLERNRWINLATLYEGSTLVRMLPILAFVEMGVWTTALRSGWLSEKRRAVAWCLAHRKELRARRRQVSTRRNVHDREVVIRLQFMIDPSARSDEHVPAWVNRIMAWYGRTFVDSRHPDRSVRAPAGVTARRGVRGKSAPGDPTTATR